MPKRGASSRKNPVSRLMKKDKLLGDHEQKSDEFITATVHRERGASSTKPRTRSLSPKPKKRMELERAAAGVSVELETVGASAQAEAEAEAEDYVDIDHLPYYQSSPTFKIKGLQRRISAITILDKDKRGYKKRPKKAESFDFDMDLSGWSRRSSDLLGEDYVKYKTQLMKDRKKHLRHHWYMKTLKWVLVALIGIFTGFTALLVFHFVEMIAHFKNHETERLLSEHGFAAGLAFNMAMMLALTLVSACLVVYGEPQAGGSGLPEVKAYLNGVIVPGFLRIRVFFAKMIGLILTVGSGLFVGPEGPIIHLGAIIGYAASYGRSWFFGIDLQLFNFLRDHQTRLQFMSVGAAAGVAAAFTAPIGAVMFSFEETSSYWSDETSNACMIASFFGASTIRFVETSNFKLDEGGYLGFHNGKHERYNLRELCYFWVLALIGGIAGALFNGVNIGFMKKRAMYIGKEKRLRKLLEVAFFAMLTSILCLVPSWFGPCFPTPSHPPEDFHLLSLNCPEGQYNQLATWLLTSQHEMLSMLYSDTTNSDISNDMFTLVYVTIFVFIMVATTVGIAVPSGLFIPTLLIGALIGRTYGEFLHSVLGKDDLSHPGVYALMGSGAMMAGFSRMTVSIVIILVEISNDFHNLLPIMMIVITSKWVADRFNDPLYEAMMKVKGLKYLEAQRPVSMTVLATEGFMKKEVQTLKSVSSVRDIRDALEHTSHNGFPVIGHDGGCCGLIHRAPLLSILQERAFQSVESLIGGESQLLHPHLFAESFDSGIQLQDIHLTDEELDHCCVDLRFYMDESPLTCHEKSPIERAYTLFRMMGMRHLILVDDFNHVKGILTRTELYEALEKLHSDAHMSIFSLCCIPTLDRDTVEAMTPRRQVPTSPELKSSSAWKIPGFFRNSSGDLNESLVGRKETQDSDPNLLQQRLDAAAE